ncbi:glycosyltransferase family 1 protein [Sclerotinia borealis F-4128]|uniref:Glycosyltransferase family 1 protein n=1 Tax=Sclerotinia borealis (strain F-4128) TaxID=1432307 RepID=W9CFH5_SCLBF|nr:glycosyltransferase family 1 protein [Sclerotinia borealis F-4128]
MSTPKPPGKILLITNSEYGQSNVVLATAYELILNNVEVHIASFEAPDIAKEVSNIIDYGNLRPPIRTRVDYLNAGVYGPIPLDSIKAVFHPIDSPGMAEKLAMVTPGQEAMRHGVGLREAWRIYAKIPSVLSSYTPDEYVKGVNSCVEIVKSVNPDGIVMEKLCAQGFDACALLGKKTISITPNSFKDTLAQAQPNGFPLWGLAVECSGFGFPLPWYLIPFNIILMIRLIIIVVTSPTIKAIEAGRKEAKIPGQYPFFVPYSKDIHYLLPTAREIDLKLPYIPENITTCGPLTLPSYPLSKTDPELLEWLEKKPTVLVNLGSHVNGNVESNRNIATGIRILLAKNTNMQVLWKLKPSASNFDPAIKEILAPVAGQVRLVKWLDAEPISILRSGHIIVSVHHGGANSYYESIETGIPQLALPCWFDTYDYTEKMEFFGVGIWGSKTSAPGVDGEEFGKALIRVTEDSSIKEKAKEIGELIRKKYGGRKDAARKILELIDGDFGLHAKL